ncbi:MAG TPA: DUF1707 domain-containing protein [Rugosimonospora sp.]|nr:DUF1707 domain-containing protein [Rugosimonospora sp.]
MEQEDQVRVSDAEREAIVARLNAATGEGRLTLEEFADRAGRAYAARTRGELNELVADLPPAAPGQPRRPPSQPPTSSQTVPVGAIKHAGRLRLEQDTEFSTIVGSVKLNLRQAEIAAEEVAVQVRTVVGSVKVWVPHGVRVDVDGNSFVGSRQVDQDDAGGYANAPLLRLRVDTVIGSVKVYRV